MIVDNAVRNWVGLAVEEKLVSREGMGLAVGRYLGLLLVGTVSNPGLCLPYHGG